MCSMSVGEVGKKSMISVLAYFSIHFMSKSHTFRHMDSHPDPLARQWPNFTNLFSTVIATRIHLSWSDLGKKSVFLGHPNPHLHGALPPIYTGPKSHLEAHLSDMVSPVSPFSCDLINFIFFRHLK